MTLPELTFAAPRAGPRIEPGALALPADLLRQRRERFLEQAGEGVAILCSAPEMFKSRDTEIRYRQDSDFYYLTGFVEPAAVAVLSPHDPDHRFTLFVRPRDEEREVWSGARAGPEGAREHFGADAAYPITELEEHLRKLIEPADRILYGFGSSAKLDLRVIEELVHFRRARQRTGKGPAEVVDPASILSAMRRVKEPLELERLRLAAAVSADGHLAAMRAARPGVGEWELEATIEAAFRLAGASGPAFPSIVGSGPNGSILHYHANHRRTREGDLVLIDAGAEVGMYCGDISRTFPVSGRFTAPQRALYEVVLAAEEAVIDAIRPATPFAELHQTAVRVLVEGMLELGLLAGERDALIDEEAHKRFYMHQTSHWLGLDVHDVGLYKEGGEPVRLEPNMVLTVEPGLYIPEGAENVPAEFRGLGIRIEDDLLVTDAGHEILTRAAPVAIAEVEEVVRGS